MKDIETIRDIIKKDHQDDPELFYALNRIESLLVEAPRFFTNCVEEEKLDWLKRAELLYRISIIYNDKDSDSDNYRMIVRS